MRLFDEGDLSPSVIIWGATNRPQDKAGAFSLCEPLRTRFNQSFNIATPGVEESATSGVFLATWQEELEDWLEWAENRGAHSTILSFHRSTNGRHLYEWSPATADPSLRMPDFRSWETVIRLCERGLASLKILSATIGKPVASAYFAFSQMAGTMPLPEEIYRDPEGCPVPDSPGGLYVVVETLASHTTPATADAAWRYIGRLPVTYGALCSRRMQKRFHSEGVDLMSFPASMAWHQANKDVILASR
jgi:hypothetical protein